MRAAMDFRIIRGPSVNDNMNAIVVDLGTQSIRIGHVQDNSPKVELPSFVGVSSDGMPDIDPLELGPGPSNRVHDNNKYYMDVTAMCVPRKGTNGVIIASDGVDVRLTGLNTLYPRVTDMEVVNCMSDGMVDNWDLFDKLLDYAYRKCLFVDPRDYSVLFSETPFNTPFKRSQLAELMFEKYRIPAIFICKNAVLAAFSTGRSSALVVDSGASHTTVTPVYDGYAITNASFTSPLGGDFITARCHEYLDVSVGRPVRVFPLSFRYLFSAPVEIPRPRDPALHGQDKISGALGRQTDVVHEAEHP